MPAGCLEYSWDSLGPSSQIEMCRPNHYYEYLGIATRWWGWNQNTGQINNPSQLATWISTHPGKIWIIGNEPDLNSQDGLTREQYAAMFKTYYDFIRPLDPSARFAIAGITGGSNNWSLNYSIEWYGYVLNYYKTTYGYPMPVDIWNVHSYAGAMQIEDPDQPIRDFVQPFVNWCHTVDNGRYAGAEVWITEMPIGEWMGALNQEWIIWFAERYLPRLEQSGVSRWFWFISQAWDSYTNVGLVNSNGTVSALGQAYASLANSYPNPVPPVEPFVPQPAPQYFQDSFSSGGLSDPWMVKAGVWVTQGGAIRQQRVNPEFEGETCVLQHRYSDFSADLDMRVNNATDTANWVGFVFRMNGRFESITRSGYLVYMRRNGAIGLYNIIDHTVQEIPAAVADGSQWQNFRVTVVGWRIQIWVNGALLIDWTDTNHRFGEGYLALQVYRTDSSYRNVRVTKLPNGPSVLQPALTNSQDTLTASWALDQPPWGITETQYAVGTTAGGTDTRGWTSVTGNTLTATNLSLNAGARYYVSVRFKDTFGLWSSAGTGGGTTVLPPKGQPSPVAAAKMKADGQPIEPFIGIISAGTDALGTVLYVQDLDRASGIRVATTTPMTAGTVVNVAGKVSSVGPERTILPTGITVLGSLPPPTPLHLAVMNVGGADWKNSSGGVYQYGVPRSLALNNVGLLVSVSGRVTDSRGFSLTVWDGSAWDTSSPPKDIFGSDGVLVATRGLVTVPLGAMVRVTGISSLRTSVAGIAPQLLIRTASDVEVLTP
ncbi:MAG: DUF1080 domain-containing protein [Armatimonadetes bacterium]|nr:DUF1080 domain-containing protein [Armatimonadota bacterium]